MGREVASSAHAELSEEQVAVHVMARETRLKEIIANCEATWAQGLKRVYYHTDRTVATTSYTITKIHGGSDEKLSGNDALA